jgi:hypothetical protein
MFFSDLHVQLISRGILNPGEQLVSQTVTSYVPWWAFGLIQRQHLVLATDQRLILVDHRLGFFPAAQRLHAVDSIAWSNVQELRVTGLFLKKKLRIKGTGERGPVSHKLVIPNRLFGLLAPMKNNMQGARAIAAAHLARTQGAAPALAPAAMAPALGPAPVSQSYGQPPQSYGPMPASNAPGYNSVPPPPGFVAPIRSPFDPPPRSY